MEIKQVFRSGNNADIHIPDNVRGDLGLVDIGWLWQPSPDDWCEWQEEVLPSLVMPALQARGCNPLMPKHEVWIEGAFDGEDI